MKRITSEFESETLSLSHPYFFCFVNATILESDVFNMCGISGALHPKEARVYVPVWQWLEMYNVHNLEFFWTNALCCSDLRISECKFVSLSLSPLVKTETKLAVNYWYLINSCIPCKKGWLINDLIDIWLFPSVYVFCKKIWFIVIVELKYQRWNRKKRKKC